MHAVENALEYRLGVAIGLPIAGWARFSAGDSIGHVDETIGRLAVEWCLSWLASFMHYDRGYFDLEQKTLQLLDNPFGPRLSPMS